MQNQKIPTLNITYNYFDDGKVKLSRMDKVTITDIIPFSNIGEDILTKWKEEVETCNWLYAEQTDFFIKGFLQSDKEETIFTRTKDGGWFSFGGLSDGRLDIDDILLNDLIFDFFSSISDKIFTDIDAIIAHLKEFGTKSGNKYYNAYWDYKIKEFGNGYGLFMNSFVCGRWGGWLDDDKGKLYISTDINTLKLKYLEHIMNYCKKHY